MVSRVMTLAGISVLIFIFAGAAQMVAARIAENNTVSIGVNIPRNGG